MHFKQKIKSSLMELGHILLMGRQWLKCLSLEAWHQKGSLSFLIRNISHLTDAEITYNQGFSMALKEIPLI